MTPEELTTRTRELVECAQQAARQLTKCTDELEKLVADLRLEREND